jgi:hypothetical protein
MALGGRSNPAWDKTEERTERHAPILRDASANAWRRRSQSWCRSDPARFRRFTVRGMSAADTADTHGTNKLAATVRVRIRLARPRALRSV